MGDQPSIFELLRQNFEFRVLLADFLQPDGTLKFTANASIEEIAEAHKKFYEGVLRRTRDHEISVVLYDIFSAAIVSRLSPPDRKRLEKALADMIAVKAIDVHVRGDFDTGMSRDEYVHLKLLALGHRTESLQNPRFQSMESPPYEALSPQEVARFLTQVKSVEEHAGDNPPHPTRDPEPPRKRAWPLSPAATCHLLSTRGCTMDSKILGETFDIPVEAALKAMDISAAMDHQPWSVNREQGTVALTQDGVRMCSVAAFLVRELKGEPKKLADAMFRFLIAPAELGDREQRLWSIDESVAFHTGLVKAFLGEEGDGPLQRAAEEVWSTVHAYYRALHPKGWKKFERGRMKGKSAGRLTTYEGNLSARVIGCELYRRGGSALSDDVLEHFGIPPTQRSVVLRLFLETTNTPLRQEGDRLFLRDEAKPLYERLDELVEQSQGDKEKLAFLVVENFLLKIPAGTVNDQKEYIQTILDAVYGFLPGREEREAFRKHAERLTRSEATAHRAKLKQAYERVALLAGAIGCELFKRSGSAPIDELLKHFHLAGGDVDRTLHPLLTADASPLRREGDRLFFREEARPLYERLQELLTGSKGDMEIFARRVIDYIVTMGWEHREEPEKVSVSMLVGAARAFLSPEDQEAFRKHVNEQTSRERGKRGDSI